MVDHAARVVLADDTAGLLLHRQWRLPRREDVLSRHTAQLRHVPSDVTGSYDVIRPIVNMAGSAAVISSPTDRC